MITYSSGKFAGAEKKSFMTIKLRDVVDSTALLTLLKVVEGASQASLVSRRFEEPEAAPAAPAATCIIARVALVVLRDSNGQIYKVTVPGVNPTFIVEASGNKKNQLLNDAKCTAIANAYGTATGKTGVTCISSSIHQKGNYK